MTKKPRKRNYAKETAYESTPEQKRRRAARGRARYRAQKRLGKAALKGKELDHIGFHRLGSLDHVPVRIVSKKANRKRQPPTKARGSKRNTK